VSKENQRQKGWIPLISLSGSSLFNGLRRPPGQKIFFFLPLSPLFIQPAAESFGIKTI
jgi:hypothetical protein